MGDQISTKKSMSVLARLVNLFGIDNLFDIYLKHLLTPIFTLSEIAKISQIFYFSKEGHTLTV
jgi:hypothetical protein